MLVRSALLLLVLSSGAQAAAFDDLKGYLASCLRFEMDGVRGGHGLNPASRMRVAVDRCGDDIERLDRADGRRLRGDGGLSPSTKAVILGVMSRTGSGIANVRY